MSYNGDMSKRQVIMLLGVLIIFLPFLGFTSFWDMIINVLVGLLIIGIAYRMAPIAKIPVDKIDNASTPDLKVSKESVMPTTSDLPFVDHLSGTEGSTTNTK